MHHPAVPCLIRRPRLIERVLPSLGEDSVVLRSLGDILAGITATTADDSQAHT